MLQPPQDRGQTHLLRGDTATMYSNNKIKLYKRIINYVNLIVYDHSYFFTRPNKTERHDDIIISSDDCEIVFIIRRYRVLI